MPITSTRPPRRLAVETLEDRTVPTFLSAPGGVTKVNVNTVNVPTGGLSLAIGNVLPETGQVQINEYVTGTGPGRESLVRIYDLQGNLQLQFNPYANLRFSGGVNVAIGDVTGDASPEIVVTAASGLRPDIPQVRVFDGRGGLMSQFNVFSTGYLGGLSVAAGNVLGGISGSNRRGGSNNGQFKSEIIVGASLGNTPHVVVADAAGNILRSFLTFDAGYKGGVTVAAASVDTTNTPNSGGGGGGGGGGGNNQPVPNTNNYAEIIVGAATNVPHVKVFSAWEAGNGRVDGPGGVTERQSYFAFDPALGRGVTVAAGNTDGNQGAEIYVGLIGDKNAGGTTVRVYNGESGGLRGEFQVFPPLYSRVVNLAIGQLNPFDPDTFFDVPNPSDLAGVAGDSPFEQAPRQFFGQLGRPAGL
ncbi:MAG: hypothetical protein K2V38_18360 [Gemmataceae bacterium]|nr:hypothetical protein [Gemmataceae bacterium]